MALEGVKDTSCQGSFTVGVVTDRSGVLTSKNGKKFISIKLSDLEKYDRVKVR
jgi:hypothetical protein